MCFLHSVNVSCIVVFTGTRFCQSIFNGYGFDFVCFCQIDTCDVRYISSTTCEDIDECSAGDHGCEHTCVNTPGSYYCECDDGYSLRDNKRTCKLGKL